MLTCPSGIRTGDPPASASHMAEIMGLYHFAGWNHITSEKCGMRVPFRSRGLSQALSVPKGKRLPSAREATALTSRAMYCRTTSLLECSSCSTVLWGTGDRHGVGEWETRPLGAQPGNTQPKATGAGSLGSPLGSDGHGFSGQNPPECLK